MNQHTCVRLTDLQNLRIGHPFSPSAAQSVITRLSCPRCLARASLPPTEQLWMNTLRLEPRFLRILAAPEHLLTFSERTARGKLKKQGDTFPLRLEASYSLASIDIEPDSPAKQFFRAPLPPQITSGAQADYFTRFLIYRSQLRCPDQKEQALEDLEQADRLRQQGTGDPELYATLITARALYEKSLTSSRNLLEEALQDLDIPADRALELRLDLLQYMVFFPNSERRPAVELYLEILEQLDTTHNPLYRIEAITVSLSDKLQNYLMNWGHEFPEIEGLADSVSLLLSSSLLTCVGKATRHLPLNMRGWAIDLFSEPQKVSGKKKAGKVPPDLADLQKVA